MAELSNDLNKKNKFNKNQEDLNLFPSSLIMFKKIKYLLERAAKISRGRTITEIYKIIRLLVRDYIETIR